MPTVTDFDRLDPRFRLPNTVWAQLPVQGFGFAVFKLRETRKLADVHPMAFRFPSRAERSRGLVDAGSPLARFTLTGTRTNADTWVPASAAPGLTAGSSS